MSAEIELQPDDREVLQAERTDEPAVKVRIVGADSPVRIQALPRKAGATFQKSATTTPFRILTASDRRSSAKLVSVGQNMLIALSAAAANAPDTSRMALWPQNEPIDITADTEVWVASATGTTVISVITEFWATGE